MVIVSSLPLQLPVHPLKLKPVAGAAVTRTELLLAIVKFLLEQSMPQISLLTSKLIVPTRPLFFATDKVTVRTAKFAVHALSVIMVTTILAAVPAQSPLQPANVNPG